MKTRLLEFLRVNLHNQNGSKRCKMCTEAMKEILLEMKSNKEVTVSFRPDLNASNVCMGFHIEIIKIKQ
jgi:PP-loop superfamily ATP-utilizing enzyme